ncbi:hypothetical protein [Acinetobacter sp. AG3]|uniref:hypothetical protein n=1 Tax=Acinetobacter sp. AG3 TaxID=2912245 RepID=UPI001EF069E2|nr:hypothetical protein [Acinetobacter sp. AG3]MCG7219670.1 hypothetical protein [Acinetobacter sp. AG3]
MSLLSREKAKIDEEYFKVWDIIKLLKNEDKHDWEDIGTFLGYYDIATELRLYKTDEFWRIYEIETFEVIRTLVDDLRLYWLTGEDGLKETRNKVHSYYWLKEEIYNFKPLVELNLENLKPSINYLDIHEDKPNNQRKKDYKFYLFKQPSLNSTECACIVSEQNPAGIVDLDKFGMAQKFIYSAIKSGDLKEVNHSIDADDLRVYLFGSEIIIKGFNEDVKSISDNEKKNLKFRINELEKIIVDKDSEINKLKVIKPNEESSLLEQIFDCERDDSYAPDLVLAIKLWESIYITNPKEEDSHTNKANIWLKLNTNYDVRKQNSSASKIREITSPLKSWSPQRDKNFKK